MAGRGPAPKPSHLRQRKNKKAGATTLELTTDDTPKSKVPTIPNPDNRTWHPLTLKAWAHAWRSPMASQWLETDEDALGRLALLWDDFYRSPSADGLKEIRLQSALFGLSPLDRSRLQWEINRSDEAEDRRQRRAKGRASKRKSSGKPIDPRKALTLVAKKA